MRTHWDKLQSERAPFNTHLLWRRLNLSCFCSILQLWGENVDFCGSQKAKTCNLGKKLSRSWVLVVLGKVRIFCSILMHTWDWIPTLFLQIFDFLTITIYGKTFRNTLLSLPAFCTTITHLAHIFFGFFYRCLTENFTIVLFVAQLINCLHFTKSNVHISFLLRFVIIIYNIHLYMGCRFYNFCVGCVCGFFLV